MPPQILLVSFNSTYQHCSFGLRYLLANMKDLKEQTELLEPTIQASIKNLVEKIVVLNPKIVGFGVYIWNAAQTLEAVSILKKVAPQISIVLGGPEVSYEASTQPLVQLADYTIQGEGDLSFYQFCHNFLQGILPESKIIKAKIPEIKDINLPYRLYSDDDIKNRIIYVEASRGCPYRCEYCLSSLDKQVRSFALDDFLAEMELLLERGARQFKFVDRTFNLSIATGIRILEFFLLHIDKGLFLHFEMVPDRLPDELKALLKKFPAGSIQFEVGIQTWSSEVAKLVSRNNNYEKVIQNFQFLNEETGIHTHADLIVGLPGETLDSFAEGFNQLYACRPDEIQVGILKRLKGTPIIRHDKDWQMIYQDQQPFQVLQTKTMDYVTIQRMARFAKFWDLYANSGNFKKSILLILTQLPSPFVAFLTFADELGAKFDHLHSFSLQSLAQYLYEYLSQQPGADQVLIRECLIQDFCFGQKRRDIPEFLKLKKEMTAWAPTSITNKRNQRQVKHQTGDQ